MISPQILLKMRLSFIFLTGTLFAVHANSAIGTSNITPPLEIKTVKKVLDQKDAIRFSPEEVQQTIIYGSVKDSNGNPLPGANVTLKGTSIGTTTDIKGNFSLNVPEEADILVVSYIGFQTLEITIGNKSTFNIQLQEDMAALDEVVLKGYKKQNVEAIRAKRNQIVIGEFLSQDNIGRLPDFAAADAARRIPGINTIFQEDEATQVSVRGLAPIYTYATIDGMFLPSGDRGSRVANFETIPSSAIKTIEVYKSRTAEQDGNAIGGVFNLETRSAFDSTEDFFATGRFTVGKYDFDDIPRSESFRKNATKNGLSIRTDATISYRFGKNKQFGVIVSGSYNRKDRDEFKTPKRNYEYLNDDPNKPVPSRFYFSQYDNLISRYGGFTKLEFKPNDKFYMSLSGASFRKSDDEIRIENRFRNLEYDEKTVTPNGGRFTAGRVQLAYDHFIIDHKVDNVIFDTHYNFGKNKIDAKIGYTYGFLGEDGPWGGFNFKSDPGLSGSYKIGSSLDDISFNFDNPSFYTNPSNWDSFYVGGRGHRDHENALVYQLNYAYNMDMEEDETGWGFKTGFSSRNVDHVYNRIDMKVNVNSGAPNISFANFPLKFYKTGNFNGGKTGLVTFDNVAFENWVAQNTNTSGIDGFSKNYNRAYIWNLGSRFQIEERITAFYVMTTHKADNFTITGGLRYEDTKTDFTRIPEINGKRDENVTATEQSNYSNLLPDLNATLDITDKVRLKAAYYRAIGRGNYTQIAPVVSVDDAAEKRSIGNPNLKPRKADNFDLQFEYYFDGKSSLLSFGYFVKNIKDDIDSDQFIDPKDGYTVTTTFNTLGVDISGLEFNFIKTDFKDELPGFLENLGLSTNFTYLSGRREVKKDQYSGSIQNLPRTMLNSQLFYQKEKFDARLAWNHVGWYVKNADDNNPSDEINDDQYWKPFNQFDLTANYQITDNFSLFAEWRNFTNANRGFTRGRNLLIEDTEFGGSIWLGTTFKF